jgi:acetyltransferase-like isoleucine patch superfamily enzyme
VSGATIEVIGPRYRRRRGGSNVAPGAVASSIVLKRETLPDTAGRRLRTRMRRAAGDAVLRGWELTVELGAIGPSSARGRRFGAFGKESVICFPPTAIFNERFISIGSGTLFGPQITLSAGMALDQEMVNDPVITIGDRCLFGRGSGIVGHLRITIGDDVWTGHHVYITDQNHGYERLDLPISQQIMPERPVSIGSGSWLGHGAVVLPGASIGEHVVVGANSVVTGVLPDNCVAAGAPARVLRLIE